MKLAVWKNQPDKIEKTTAITLVAQTPTELRYLNHLVMQGKAMGSGDAYEVIVTLKEGKSVEDYKIFLSTKLHFPIEQS